MSYVIDKSTVPLLTKSKLVVSDEPSRLLLVRKVQPMPIEN
jgi:hypothetical protein